MRATPKSKRPQTSSDRLRITVGAYPAMLRDVEDGAIRVLEPFEIALSHVAEIDEEHSARRFDATLGFREIIDLSIEMVRSNEAFWIF
jgi:hypothetical protein